MTYGLRLKTALKKAEKERKELAQFLGVTPQHIGMVINGKCNMSFEMNQRTEQFLHIQPGSLYESAGTVVVSESDPVTLADQSYEAKQLSLLFDMIPVSAPIKRAKAFALASGAIVQVLQDD